LIVLGDLNETPQAATTQLLYGPPGSQFDTGGFDHPDQGDAWRLWNLAPRIAAEHRFSRIFEGQPELIDHILISHALLAGADIRRGETGSRTRGTRSRSTGPLPPIGSSSPSIPRRPARCPAGSIGARSGSDDSDVGSAERVHAVRPQGGSPNVQDAFDAAH
jgi:hypothetical protein